MESFSVIEAGGQRLLILGHGDIGNLTRVLQVEGIVKTFVSLTYLARLECSYFGQYDFCDLYDINEIVLLRGIIKNVDLLVVDIKDLFNMTIINYDNAKENIIFVTINKTIDIMHRRLGHICNNRVRYMINEGLTSLPYPGMDNFYKNIYVVGVL